MLTHSKTGYNGRVWIEITVDVVWGKRLLVGGVSILFQRLAVSCTLPRNFLLAFCTNTLRINYVSVILYCKLVEQFQYFPNSSSKFVFIRRRGSTITNRTAKWRITWKFWALPWWRWHVLKRSSVWPARLLCGTMTRKTILSDGDEKNPSAWDPCNRAHLNWRVQIFSPRVTVYAPPPPPRPNTLRMTVDRKH